jgi:hypothetical protein
MHGINDPDVSVDLWLVLGRRYGQDDFRRPISQAVSLPKCYSAISDYGDDAVGITLLRLTKGGAFPL